jgi:hypothetical protein
MIVNSLFFVGLFFISCSEYDINRTIDKSQQGEDSADSFLETEEEFTNEPNEEDTGYEESIDEGIPAATERMYLHTSKLLYSWEEDGTITTIGQFYIENDYAPNITDLAIDLSGNMYAISNQGLYRVDPTDARIEYICDTGEYLVGLTFLADGRLLAAGEAILWMDPNTCSRAVFVETGRYETSGDIVGLPDGNLYWTVIGGDALVRVDPITAQTEYIGEIGSTNLWGVGYFNNILYGFSSEGKIVHIDPDTAEIIHEENTSGQYWWGAASNPVHWE